MQEILIFEKQSCMKGI